MRAVQRKRRQSKTGAYRFREIEDRGLRGQRYANATCRRVHDRVQARKYLNASAGAPQLITAP